MARLLANRDGGTSNEYGTFAALGRLFSGDVIEGFQVVPNGTPNMTIKVNPGSGRITTGTYPSSYGYFVSHDTVGGESVTISTAAASPRIDYIVAYVDKSVTPSTSPANVNNTNNMFKFASVAGTPAGSPVVPTVGQIQTAIGAANPYIILAQVAVGASVTTITTPNISDLRRKVLPFIGTMYLAYAEISVTIQSTSSTPTGISGLSITFTAPEGASKVSISIYTRALSNLSASNFNILSLHNAVSGSVSSGNLIKDAATYSAANYSGSSVNLIKFMDVVPGIVYTFTAGVSRTGGTCQIEASANSTAYIQALVVG